MNTNVSSLRYSKGLLIAETYINPFTDLSLNYKEHDSFVPNHSEAYREWFGSDHQNAGNNSVERQEDYAGLDADADLDADAVN
jgi:hypothetical protein